MLNIVLGAQYRVMIIGRCNILNNFLLADLAYYRWFAKQMPTILFCLVVPNFPAFPPFSNGWYNGSRKRQQIVAKFQQTHTSIRYVRDNITLSFPKKLCFLFHLFQVEWKTHIVSFLKNCSTNSRIVCRSWSRYSSAIKNVWHERRLPHNLVSNFKVEIVSPWKMRKKHWISPTPFNRFSLSCHRNDRTYMSGHLMLITDDLKNVGKNLQK